VHRRVPRAPSVVPAAVPRTHTARSRPPGPHEVASSSPRTRRVRCTSAAPGSTTSTNATSGNRRRLVASR
jgi:hypothetical protein